MSIVAEIGDFLDEWQVAIRNMDEALRTKNFDAIADYPDLPGTDEPWNLVTRKGYGHLERAALLFLAEESLSQKVAETTAVRAIVRAHFELLPSAKASAQFSEDDIASRAREILRSESRPTLAFVYPLVFAPRAQKTDWEFGPVRIQSKSIFLEKHSSAFQAEREAADPTIRSLLLTDWEKYSKNYDHFATVTVADHERKLGDLAGREAAEFTLNLIRMLFRFGVTQNIRVGGGYIFESERATLCFDQTGNAMFGLGRGPWGAVLIEDNWTSAFETELKSVRDVFAAFLNWMLSGDDLNSPVQERIRYASRLIAEAYCEPHDHIRLVRIIAALEALALIDGHEKAKNLGLFCGYAGASGDAVRASAIADAIKSAYSIRNAIVHGEVVRVGEILNAFGGIEKFALDIFVGFVCLFWMIQTKHRPTSVQELRKYLKLYAPKFP